MPHKTDWRIRIPALDDVYMFQGSLYCEDCGRDIQDTMRKTDRSPPDEHDEESFDSNDFPKGPFGDGGGEADSIHHCDSNETCLNAVELPCKSKIGAWLGNSLTSDGDEWLASSIRESIFRDDAHGRQVNRLWRIKYSDPLSSLNGVEPVTGRELASPLVQQFIKSIGGQQPQIVNQVWCDLDCLYGFSMQKAVADWKQPAALIVWKSDILPDGSLDKPSKVELPISEAQEREPDDILSELIGDAAWD
jgi:hypothetical protein